MQENFFRGSELLHKPLGCNCSSGSCPLFLVIPDSCFALCWCFLWLHQFWFVCTMVPGPSWQQDGKFTPYCVFHLRQVCVLPDNCFRINSWKCFLILARISQVALKLQWISGSACCRAVGTCPPDSYLVFLICKFTSRCALDYLFGFCFFLIDCLYLFMVFKPVSLRLLLGILLLSLKVLVIANPLGKDVEGSGIPIFCHWHQSQVFYSAAKLFFLLYFWFVQFFFFVMCWIPDGCSATLAQGWSPWGQESS